MKILKFILSIMNGIFSLKNINSKFPKKTKLLLNRISTYIKIKIYCDALEVREEMIKSNCFIF